MNKLYISKSNDPYFNLSYEHDLLNNIGNDTIFFLYINSQSIIIGHNQNPYCECNMERISENKIALVRRVTGGGAVYHDLGNLNFSFIMPSSKKNLTKQYQVIINALEQLNIKVTKSGRNDLFWDSKKISGNAYYDDGINYLHHGTLLVDVNLKQIDQLLEPSPLKLLSKATKSIKSSVINLKEINPFITIDLTINYLIKSFIKYYNETIIKEIYFENEPPLYNYYQTKKWLLEMSPKYNAIYDYQDKVKIIRLFMIIHNNIIQDITISSDSLQPINIVKLKTKLIGLTYDEKKISNILINNNFQYVTKKED